MWVVCIISISHVVKLNGYGGLQAKVNGKRLRFKGWETLVINLLTRQLVSSLTCQSAFSCPLFSKNFNVMAAIFSANRLPCRK